MTSLCTRSELRPGRQRREGEWGRGRFSPAHGQDGDLSRQGGPGAAGGRALPGWDGRQQQLGPLLLAAAGAGVARPGGQPVDGVEVVVLVGAEPGQGAELVGQMGQDGEPGGGGRGGRSEAASTESGPVPKEHAFEPRVSKYRDTMSAA